MPTLDVDPFARRFRALSPSERRDFLAALWEARGTDVTIVNGTLIAVPDGESPAEQGDSPIRLELVGLFPRGETDADVVIATRDSTRASAYAADNDADYLTPTDLHEFLLYGIDREVADDISRAHLGTPIEIPEREHSPRSVVTPAVLLVVIVSIAAVGVLSGVWMPVTDDATLDTPSTPGETADTPTPESQKSELYPPGFDADGVTDPEEAIDAHWRQVRDVQRSAAITYHGPENTSMFPRTIRHESEGTFEREGRFHVSTVDQLRLDGVTEEREFERYGADDEVLTRIMDGNESRYSTAPRGDRTMWDSMEEFAVERYAEALRAAESSIEPITQSGMTLYRVDVTGPPDEARDEISAYEGTIFLTEEGRLVRVTVSYTHGPSNETVRLTVVYRDVGTATVPEGPDWAEDARGT